MGVASDFFFYIKISYYIYRFRNSRKSYKVSLVSNWAGGYRYNNNSFKEAPGTESAQFNEGEEVQLIKSSW